MTASLLDALSSMIWAVPFPLYVEEMKIQPSLGRENVNELLDFEIEEALNNSETRLFSFFSPEKRTVASAPPAEFTDKYR